jgi:hypothetical protein
MQNKLNIPATIVTGFLLIYVILLTTGWAPRLTGILFFLSPFLVIWMVYRIIRYDSYRGRELNENEEWGYSDKNSEELGTF